MASTNVSLSLVVCPKLPVYDNRLVAQLEEILAAVLPSWSAKLEVSTDGVEPGVRVEQAGMYKVLTQVSPVSRGIGHAVLTGSHDSLSLYLWSSASGYPPSCNGISVEILDVAHIEGRPPWEVVTTLLCSLAESIELHYGRANVDEEFIAKNICTTNGLVAIGVGLLDALPGLYWLNYFGSIYGECIGMQKLFASPAYRVDRIGSGALIMVHEFPMDWSEEDSRAKSSEVIAHLGSQFFFDRREPDRETVAPDFEP